SSATPFTRPCNAIFIQKLNAGGSALVYTWRYSNPQQDNRLVSLVVDAAGNSYMKRSYVDPSNLSNQGASFGKLDSDGNMAAGFAPIRFGSPSDPIALDGNGFIYQTGSIGSG